MTGKQKLVVIGNGMAPGRMLEHLLELDPRSFQVTVFSAEPRVNYSRLMLSPVLSGEKSYEDIIIHDDDWYARQGVKLRKAAKVTAIDRTAKTVACEDGDVVSYDKLVIATGSNPVIIPIPGYDLDGVLTYRDLDDVERMIDVSRSKGRAVVIGGGLLGLEAAAGLKMRGMDVTVLHLMPTVMERQLDAAAGLLLQKAFEERGITVMTAANTRQILGHEGRVTGVELDDGTRLEARMVVMAAGIRPSTDLARRAGLSTNHGIVVADSMLTSDASVFALGECAEHRGICYGLVAPLYDMAKVVAEQLAGNSRAIYQGSVTATKLKVTGIDLYSAGDFAAADDREEIVLRDASAGVYKRIILKENRIIGTVMFGETSDGPWYFDLLRNGTDVSALRDTLIFGRSYQGGEPLDPMAAVAALPDDADSVICNGPGAGAIGSASAAKTMTPSDRAGLRGLQDG